MSRWIQRTGAPDAVARVVCAGRAGGSARDFDGWRAVLGPLVETAAVQLPGRLDRFTEPPVGDLPEIAGQVAAAVTALEPLPYVLFGDCMGALVAFETARALRRSGAPAPAALVVASYPAPHRIRTERPYHDAPAAELKRRLYEVGGVPPVALADDELFELLLPVLRADFAAFERYRYVEEEPLGIPVHAVVGADDLYVPLAAVREWSEHVGPDGEFTARTFPGGHFFLREGDEPAAWVRGLALAAAGGPR
ncbi:thioesterase II family protein [Kitasatospora phosalacinea]|uniref:PhpL n=1 Tax=Kitasatospora phosalacinea TaxID=2065 RepID=A0A0M3N0G0_9ACTN|nr:thioesterase domain-containing protein [Kitasatospora phosalacinea]AKO69618.1 PhpL [Kitasatospora phosalacinea]